MSWGPVSLDGSPRLPPPLPRLPPLPHPLQHPPLLQSQPPPRPPQGPAGTGGQAKEVVVVAVSVGGPMAPPLGPGGLPAASAGPPLQLPGAVPPLVRGLAPGGAPRKGPPVGVGIMSVGPCCPHNPQHKRSWSLMPGSVRGPQEKKQKDSFSRD